MAIHFVEGIAHSIDRSPARLLFRVGDHQLSARPHSALYALEAESYVQALVSDVRDEVTEEVWILKSSGADPIYLGPGLSWTAVATGGIFLAIGLITRHAVFFAIPLLLVLIHYWFLSRRIEITNRFASELSTRLALAAQVMRETQRQVSVNGDSGSGPGLRVSPTVE
jgi:hypothetical protein